MSFVISFDALQTWATDTLAAAGAARWQAERGAQALVRASLRGVDTHGIARLPAYVEQLVAGDLVGTAVLASEDRGGVLMVDAGRSLGPAAGVAIIDQLVRRLEGGAIAAAFVREVGHLASLGIYALRAAEAGFVALVCQETPPIMAPLGATGPAIGNNPLAFACPRTGGPPIVFDTAMSVVARGKLFEAARIGRRTIGEGWAMDAQGAPTCDVHEALAGALLPFGGHKGIGLAMIVQVLAGSLTGSLSSFERNDKGSTSGAGAFFLLIDPARIVGRDTFDRNVEAWLAHFRTQSDNGRFPGENAHREEACRRRSGIPLSPPLAQTLLAMGDRLGTRLVPNRAA